MTNYKWVQNKILFPISHILILISGICLAFVALDDADCKDVWDQPEYTVLYQLCITSISCLPAAMCVTWIWYGLVKRKLGRVGWRFQSGQVLATALFLLYAMTIGAVLSILHNEHLSVLWEEAGCSGKFDFRKKQRYAFATCGTFYVGMLAMSCIQPREYK